MKQILIDAITDYEYAQKRLDKEAGHENIGRIAGVIGLIVIISSMVNPEQTNSQVGSIGIAVASVAVLFGAWSWFSPPSKNKNRQEATLKEFALNKIEDLGFERIILDGRIFLKGSDEAIDPKDGDNFE